MYKRQGDSCAAQALSAVNRMDGTLQPAAEFARRQALAANGAGAFDLPPASASLDASLRFAATVPPGAAGAAHEARGASVLALARPPPLLLPPQLQRGPSAGASAVVDTTFLAPSAAAAAAAAAAGVSAGVAVDGLERAAPRLSAAFSGSQQQPPPPPPQPGALLNALGVLGPGVLGPPPAELQPLPACSANAQLQPPARVPSAGGAMGVSCAFAPSASCGVPTVRPVLGAPVKSEPNAPAPQLASASAPHGVQAGMRQPLDAPATQPPQPPPSLARKRSDGRNPSSMSAGETAAQDGALSRSAPLDNKQLPVQALVHAFHCVAPLCLEPSCAGTKNVIKRMEVHVSVCKQDSLVCRVCRLWRVLLGTTSGGAQLNGAAIRDAAALARPAAPSATHLAQAQAHASLLQRAPQQQQPQALLAPQATPQLQPAGGAGGEGCLLYTSPSPRD